MGQLWGDKLKKWLKAYLERFYFCNPNHLTFTTQTSNCLHDILRWHTSEVGLTHRDWHAIFQTDLFIPFLSNMHQMPVCLGDHIFSLSFKLPICKEKNDKSKTKNPKNTIHWVHAITSGTMIGLDANSHNNKLRWIFFQIKMNCGQTTA